MCSRWFQDESERAGRTLCPDGKGSLFARPCEEILPEWFHQKSEPLPLAMAAVRIRSGVGQDPRNREKGRRLQDHYRKRSSQFEPAAKHCIRGMVVTLREFCRSRPKRRLGTRAQGKTNPGGLKSASFNRFSATHRRGR